MSDEKKFLHDLGTPLGTVFILVDSILEAAQGASTPASAATIDKLESISKSLTQVQEMIKDRRKLLSERNDG